MRSRALVKSPGRADSMSSEAGQPIVRSRESEVRAALLSLVLALVSGGKIRAYLSFRSGILKLSRA
jgi:hypothetical protein